MQPGSQAVMWRNDNDQGLRGIPNTPYLGANSLLNSQSGGPKRIERQSQMLEFLILDVSDSVILA
jgi:hypothetical protein